MPGFSRLDRTTFTGQDQPDAALTRQEQACAMGSNDGCATAMLHETGTAAASDPARALEFYKSGCDLERSTSGDACEGYLRLAAATLDPMSPDIDATLAEFQRETATLARAGCEEGTAEDCRKLADLLSRATSEGKRLYAPALYRRACSGGDIEACVIHALRGGFEEQERQAMLEEACTAGSASRCVWLDQPVEDRLARLERMCDDGAVDACREIGFALIHWKVHWQKSPPAQDPERAVALFERACAFGDAEGCAALALHIDPSTDTPELTLSPKDAARALALYRQSCDGGST